MQKAGLVELTGDDRAALYSAFLTLAMMLRSEDREHTLALWRRGGKAGVRERQHAWLTAQPRQSLQRLWLTFIVRHGANQVEDLSADTTLANLWEDPRQFQTFGRIQKARET